MKKTIVYLIAAIPAMASMSFAQQQGGVRQRGQGMGGPAGADPTGLVDPRAAGGRRGGIGGPGGDPAALGGRRGTIGGGAPAPRVSTEMPSPETPKPKPVSDPYKPLLQVSIFSRDRRSSDDTPGLLTQTNLPDRPDSYYVLRGVVMENNQPVAFVENTHDTSGADGGPGPNAYIHVKVGEPLAGGKVTAITLDQIEFERSESAFSTRVKVGYALNNTEVAPPDDSALAVNATGMSAQQAALLMRNAGRGAGGYGGANFDPSLVGTYNGGGGRVRGTGRGGTGGFGGGFDPSLIDPSAAFGPGGGRGGRGGGGGGRGGRGGGGGGAGAFGG